MRHSSYSLCAIALALVLPSESLAQGQLRAWGMNNDGQASVPEGLGMVRFAACGSFHSVAVRIDGTVAAWGRNDYGQCNVPGDLMNVQSVATAGEHTLAHLTDRSVRGWGRNDYGQAGIPADIGICQMIAAGNAHNVVVKQDGSVRCWGYNSDGECNVPAGIGAVTAISAGGYHSAALREDGSIVCWGYNGFGECNVPAKLGPAVKISASGFHTAAILANGSVRVWGRNDYGQCNVPTLSGTPVEIVTAALHTGVRFTDGRATFWGWNDYGQCDVPTNVGAFGMITAGGYHTMAIDRSPNCAPHPSAVLWPTASGGNDHYYARIAQALTWEQARVAAQQLGGHLATITSAAENAFITPLVIDGSNNVSHLGGYRVQNGWAWVTGEPWGYSNWYPGEPNNNSGDENFLATWVSPGTWNDIFPSYLAHFVVEWGPGPHDCNNNQICDIEEIAANSDLDINRDGALDSCQCIADVVADGAINGVDLARVINDWGMANSVADINRDGIVAGADLALVLSSWGPCAP